MKRSLFCVLLCICFLAGCNKAESPQASSPQIITTVATETIPPASESTDATVIAETTIATEPESTSKNHSDIAQSTKIEHPSTGYAVYDGIVEKCIWASLHALPDDIDLLDNKQISNVFRFNDINDTEYPFYFICKDLDNDGDEELLVFRDSIEDSPIYAAYTITNGWLTWLLNGGERNWYYLRADGKIGNHSSFGAMYTTEATYTYKDDVLSLDECYFTDGSQEDGNYWFYSQKEPYDPNATSISQETYETETANMYKTYISLNGTALRDYMEQDEQAIRFDIQQANQNESQFHGKEKYELWDIVLNRLWKILKYRLSSEEMNQLTQEQLTWIDEKEAAAKNEDLENGFEIQAEYTKNRIAELIIMLQQ